MSRRATSLVVLTGVFTFFTCQAVQCRGVPAQELLQIGLRPTAVEP